MKLLTILFAIYLLLLPCLPCSDSDASVMTNSTTMAATLQSAINHTDHEQEDEACNPFCNCICCGHILTPGFHFAKLTISPRLLPVKEQYAFANAFLSSNFFASIWQPPRLS